MTPDPGLVYHKFFTPDEKSAELCRNELQICGRALPPLCGCAWLVEVGVPHIRWHFRCM